MSDSCNRPDLQEVTIRTGGREFRTTVIREGEDLLIPADVLAEIFQVPITVDHSRGIVQMGTQEKEPALDDDLKTTIVEAVNLHTERIHELCRYLNEHPVIDNQEEQALQPLTDMLGQAGFTVTGGLSGRQTDQGEETFLSTAFLAEAQGIEAGPTLAVMLEYDPLPREQSCGLMATAGLAAVLGLKSVMDRLPGRLRVYGIPAEEGSEPGGKELMVAAGFCDDVDIAMIAHGGDRWDAGSMWLSSKTVTMTFKGRPAHAAAAPHQGRSALDALVLAYHGMEMMREHVTDDVQIQGIIQNGGAAANIVPEEAVAVYTVQALDNDYLNELTERVDQVAQGAALASGCTVETCWSDGVKAPINVPRLDQRVLDFARKLGAAPIKPLTALTSTNWGSIGQSVPTVNLWFAAAPEGTKLNTAEFFEAGVSESARSAALKAGMVLAWAGAAMLADPDEIPRIQQDFASIKYKPAGGIRSEEK